MANFVCLVDPDPERRAAFVLHVRESIAPLPGLRVGEAGRGSFHAVWACAPEAPVDHDATDGHVAIVWGRPIPRDGLTPVRAAMVAATWAGAAEIVPEAWDGYFAAVAYDTRRGLVAGVDLLGLFPLFWWSSGDVTLCGTSLSSFRHHPLFHVRLDRQGLAGILLMMHSVDGRTLLEEVHRLGPGSLLIASERGATREVPQYRLPVSTKYFDMPLEEHISLLEEVIENAVRRHVPADTAHGCLLSGGMDSRMLGGFLARHGVPITALTFGHPKDVEMYCARAVASALGFEHHAALAEMDDGVTCLERHVGLLHASSSLNSIEYWGVGDVFATMPKRITAGYLLDATLAAYIGQRPYSRKTRTMSFDNFAPYAWGWGVEPLRLRRLLALDDASALVDDTVATLRATYERYHELESRRYWAFVLNHRQRFHVGQIPWMFSFHAWPVLIACDHRLLEAAGGMATVSLDERLAQYQLICRRFPALARLPLDRNSMDCRPMIPDWQSLLKHQIRLKLMHYPRRMPSRNHQRSYYHRVYDFNNPGWRNARRHVDPYRSRWHGILDLDALDEYLPAPEATLETDDIFAESSGRKQLLGLLLWGRDYL